MEFVKCARGGFKWCHDGFIYLILLFFLLNYFSVTFKLLDVYNCIYVVYILCCEINTFGYLLFGHKCIRLTHTYTQQHRGKMSGYAKKQRGERPGGSPTPVRVGYLSKKWLFIRYWLV